MGARAAPISTSPVALPGARQAAVWLKRLLGCLIALAGLFWVFRDFHPGQLFAAIRVTNWWFVAPAVFFDILTYVLQGVRWRLLLAPQRRLRSLHATQAIYAGLFTNEVMPLRLGELVRALLVSRRLELGIGAVVPSMLVERFLDALWLAVGVGLAAMVVPLPKNLLKAGDLVGAIVLIATGAMVWIVLRKRSILENNVSDPSVRTGRAQTPSSFVSDLARGLREIGLSPSLYAAAGLSAGMLVCQALALWFVMLAYGLRLNFAVAVIVMLVVRLGTAIPNAPANVGSFQFFTVVALGLFGVEKTIAAVFSVVDFAVLTVPLWIIGFFALTSNGLNLHAVRAEISRWRNQ